jgi:alpha/beta superfamily hydrolase
MGDDATAVYWCLYAPAVAEALVLTTSDGESLEAELAPALGTPRAAMVLCHPHPQYGGTMRSIVISALFDALPALDVICLRFNFRGVEASTGTHTGGRAEPADVRAAIATLADAVSPDLPFVLTGWSFGADVALSVTDPALDGWLAIAPPLRFAPDFSVVASDPRPKLLALAEHDEFRPPAEVIEAVAPWTATQVEIIPGASHFFVGRTDRLVAAATTFVDRIATDRA